MNKREIRKDIIKLLASYLRSGGLSDLFIETIPDDDREKYIEQEKKIAGELERRYQLPDAEKIEDTKGMINKTAVNIVDMIIDNIKKMTEVTGKRSNVITIGRKDYNKLKSAVNTEIQRAKGYPDDSALYGLNRDVTELYISEYGPVKLKVAP